MNRNILILAAFLISNSVFGQFSAEEKKIIDGITTEMCACMEAEKMELKSYEAFNAALIHCMNYDASSYKPLIDSLYIQKEVYEFLVKLPDEISKSIRKDCQLVAEFYSNNGIPDLANKIQYEVMGMTIAVVNMEEMSIFYNNVFDANFKTVEKYGITLYQGKWGNQALLLCPAEIAKNDAKVNRHQFDVLVYDLDKAIELVVDNGGKAGEETKDGLGRRVITVYDPDGNSIVLIEAL